MKRWIIFLLLVLLIPVSCGPKVVKVKEPQESQVKAEPETNIQPAPMADRYAK